MMRSLTARTAAFVAATLVLTLMPASQASAQDQIDAGVPGIEVSGIVEPALENEVSFLVDNGTAVTVVTDKAGLKGVAAVEIQPDGPAFAPIPIKIEVDGKVHDETFTVENFIQVGAEDFYATLRSSQGTELQVDTVTVRQQALPVLALLGILARLGIQHALRWYGKAQVKKAVKSYLLNNIPASKWAHIMAPKHNWGSVGARSREQVADLMGSAMANGSHQPYGKTGKSAVWQYKGKIIEVTYGPSNGMVSNGWVR